jgi:hypothetical protein
LRRLWIATALAALLASPAPAQEFEVNLQDPIVRLSRIAPDSTPVVVEFETDYQTDMLWVDVVMSPPGADVKLALCSPPGFDLTPAILSRGGSIQSFTIDESAAGTLPLGLEPGVHYKVAFPEPTDRGCYQIYYEQKPGVEEQIAAVATIRSDSPNHSSLNAIPRFPIVGQPVTLTLAWFWDDTPFTNATVTAQIVRPDGARFFIAMRDDGLGADAAPGDGLWSAAFTPNQVGAHRVVASGATNFLNPSRVESLTEFEVRAAPLTLSGPISLSPVDADGNGLFEALDATFSVEAVEAGIYEFSLAASGEAPTNLVERTRVDLPVGSHSVTIRFPAKRFRMLKEGPYIFGPAEAQRLTEAGAVAAGFLSQAAQLDLTLADLELPEITLYGAWHDRSTIFISNWEPNILYTVDPGTAEATVVTDIDDRFRLPSGGATFLRGKLYLSNVWFDEGNNDTTLSLGTLDTMTGEITRFIEQGPVTGSGGNNWNGLASDESAGLLYTVEKGVIGGGAGDETLLAIDLDGVVTTIRDDLPIVGDGLAFDDVRGVIYATDGRTGTMHTIDPTTGETTLLGPIGVQVPFGRSFGLAYDEACEVLYAMVGRGADSSSTIPDYLYRVDTETGAFELVGETQFLPALAWGAEGFDGFPFECPRPPPADLALEVTPRVDAGPLNSTRALTATVSELLDGASSPRVGQPVRVEVVAGPNAGAGTEMESDAQGQVAFSYDGTGGIGADEIVVSLTNEDDSIVSETAIQFWDRDCNQNGTPDTCEFDCLAFDRQCSAFPSCGGLGAAEDGIVDLCLRPRFCDVNDDGTVDLVDIDAIVAGRNRPSEGEGDPRDADLDGTITHADARLCTLECDTPRCSAPPPPATTGCGLGGEITLLLLGFKWLDSRRRRQGQRDESLGSG